MKILKKLAALLSAVLITGSLFSCSWQDVTITPEGVTPPAQNNNNKHTLTSNGTYGLVYDEGLDFCVVTGYHGSEADVFIPAEWNGKPVSGINSYAFNENENVESITITSAIKSVGKNALVGSYKVYCEAEGTHDCADPDCTAIHPAGWHRSWYQNSADPSYVEWGCGTLGSFSWSTNTDGDIVITGYIGNPERLNIPAKIGKRTVVEIAKDAFNDCSTLEVISLPDTLKKIGSFAFRYCTSLKSVTIPEGVTVVSKYMFEGCSSLESVKLSSKTEEIGDYAFANCKALTRIDIPNTVKSVGKYVFQKSTAIKIHLWGFEQIPEGWHDEWCADGNGDKLKYIFEPIE